MRIEKLFKIFVIGALALAVAGCGATEKNDTDKYSRAKELMATRVQIDTCLKEVRSTNIEAIYEKVWQRLEEIAWRMNVFDEKSDVAKINNAYAQPVIIPIDTYLLVKEAKRMNEMTYGAFDITVWPLIELWQKAGQKDRLPSPQEVQLAKQATGENVVILLDNGSVQLTHPLAKIDLGGIAKGYALDEAARILRENGVNNFYIDAGGDIYVGGHNCRGQKWRIGIRDPRARNDLIEVVAVSDKAVATSGLYEQYRTIEGQRFSHIINPLTGYPQRTVLSATVIAPNGTRADALATALTVLNERKGVGLIEDLGPSYSGLVMERVGKKVIKYSSENFDNFRLKKR